MLTVRVLPEGLGHKGHQVARNFYRSVGFYPLEQDRRGLLLGMPLPELEDWERDCV